ncbi:hypothetical protein Tco_1520293, partial [Tanacetum coccineum]
WSGDGSDDGAETDGRSRGTTQVLTHGSSNDWVSDCRYEIRLQMPAWRVPIDGSELAMIGLEYEDNHWQIKAVLGDFQAVSCTRSSTRNDISTPLSWALIGRCSKKTKIPLRAWAIKWTPHAADASF